MFLMAVYFFLLFEIRRGFSEGLFAPIKIFTPFAMVNSVLSYSSLSQIKKAKLKCLLNVLLSKIIRVLVAAVTIHITITTHKCAPALL